MCHVCRKLTTNFAVTTNVRIEFFEINRFSVEPCRPNTTVGFQFLSNSHEGPVLWTPRDLHIFQLLSGHPWKYEEA